MSPRKLLFVDDEPDLALLVEQQFEGKINEYEVELIFAENGLEALKSLEANKDVEVVLTDINMPIMDGLEFVEKAKKLERLLKIVMVSAYHDMPNIRKAMNKGAYDFITKPIDFEDLSETICKALRAVDQIKAEEAELRRLKEIEKEMEMVKKIQASMLPSAATPFFQNASFDVFGMMASARVMGGDFYDFFPAGDNKLAIVVGETAGKGMAAALYITSAREAVRGFINQASSMETCVKQVNDFLCYQKREDAFTFGLFFGIFSVLTGELEYISVGLPPPLKISCEGKSTEQAAEQNSSIGSSLDAIHPIERTQLKKNESFVICSSGIFHLNNKENALYSASRLKEVVETNYALPLSALVDNLTIDVRNFIFPLEQTRDYVVLCLKYKGEEKLD